MVSECIWSSRYLPRLAPVLKTFFINVPFHILAASLTLMALNRAIRVRLAIYIQSNFDGSNSSGPSVRVRPIHVFKRYIA